MTNTQTAAPGVAAIVEQLMADFDNLAHAEKNLASRGPMLYGDAYEEVKAPIRKARLELKNSLRTALQASAAAVEPVEYQIRMRPIWFDEGKGWQDWTKVSKETYEDTLKLSGLPHYNEWQYEARALYTAPPLPAQVQEAEELPPLPEATWPRNVGTPSYTAEEVQNYVRACLASRTPAPGMAGGVGPDVSSTQKGGPNADGSTLRTDAVTVGRDTVTNAQDRVNLDAFTDLALLRESDLLRSIAGDLEIMLASATQHASEECVTGYTVKTGALHRIIGTLVGNGFRVTVPAAPHPSPAPQAAGAAETEWLKFDIENPPVDGLYWVRSEAPEVDVDVDDYGQTVGRYTGNTEYSVALVVFHGVTDSRPDFEVLDKWNSGDLPSEGWVTHYLPVGKPAFPAAGRAGS